MSIHSANVVRTSYVLIVNIVHSSHTIVSTIDNYCSRQVVRY